MAPRSAGAARTAKYQAALDGGHDVLVLISEVWGGFSPEAMRFLGELSQARNDGVDRKKVLELFGREISELLFWLYLFGV